MNVKRFWFGSIAVFLLIFVTDFIIHGLLLKNIYMATASVWRPEIEMQSKMWMMWIGYLITALSFTYIYVRGYEPQKNNLPQGFRYGTLLGVFLGSQMSLSSYVIYPIPGMLAVYWFVASLAQGILSGMLVSSIYRQ